METDRELSAFAGKFVPLKVTTDGNADWNKWANTYPTDGSGIPIVYVIRADGEKLYGKRGAPPGDELQKLLFSSLQQAGRIFTDAEVGGMEAAIPVVEKALADKDLNAAAAALGPLAAIGPLGDLQSHSELAVKLDELYKQFSTAAEESLTSAKAQLGDATQAFDGILLLVESEQLYAPFPLLKTSIADAMREIQRNSDLKAPLAQAEALHRARRNAAADNPLVRKRAGKMYELVITRYPGTPAAQLALKELAEVDPDSDVLADAGGAAEPDSEYRTWTDSTGRFKVEAKFVEFVGGKVRLLTRDGKTLNLPLEKLSTEDQAQVNQQ